MGLLYSLRSLLFVVIVAVSLVIFVPFLLLFFRTSLETRNRVARWWMYFHRALVQHLGGIDFRVEGLDALPGSAVIYFAKHQSTWETLVLQTLLPHYVWILKKEALRIPFFGWGLALLEPIAIDRSSGRKAVDQIVDQGKVWIERGSGILIFPEGTRREPGAEPDYKIGGGILAVATGAPVVPVALNSGMFWPPKSLFLKRPGTIDLRFGPAFDPSGMTPEQVVAKAQDWIEPTCRELMQQAEFRNR
ncbi:MAG: lysophospholipid acyltransferase family protein [Xanthomonadales bacterium]|nr:lysophospholipid acyltransferase family protein [Xanthomonadales bacterium]